MSVQPLALDPPGLRQAFGQFPTGVVAVCAMTDHGPVGLTASTFVAVSLEPPLVSICIRSESTTWPILRRCPRLGISVLAEGHQDTARALAGTARDRFTGLDLDPRDDGALFIQESPLSLSATVVEDFLAGDRELVLCRVNEVRTSDDVPPLVFHRSTMNRLRAH